MAHFEKFLAEEKIYDGKILSLSRCTVELENGRTTFREVVRHHGGVCVAALDSEERLLMVRQFRFPAGEELLELPAGKLEKGEEPMACGFRELEEETGHTAARLIPLARMLPTPAYCTEVIHIYRAEGLTPTRQHLDPGEFLSVERVPFDEAVAMVLDGKIPDAKTQLGILALAALRNRETGR